MRVSSTQARKQRLQKIYDVAAQASRARDHFRLYQAVRELAPKQRNHRVILRSHTGGLTTPAAEADWLQQWFADLYHDPAPPTAAGAFDWPRLQTLPLCKALP